MKNKKRKKKTQNNIIGLCLCAVCFLILFIGAAYIVIAPFIDKVSDEDGSRPVFISDAGKNFSVSLGNVTKQNVKVSLQNNLNTTSICHYNIYWQWDETAEGYYASGEDLNELTISGVLDGTELFSDIQIKDFHLAETRSKIYSGYLVNIGGKVANQNWDFEIDFQKLDVDQTKHNNKKYGAKILIEDVMCSETEFLADIIVDDPQISEENGYRYMGENPHNYVCFGTNEEVCPEKNLYRILAYENNQIKLVSALTYGVGMWSEEYIAGLQNSYIYYQFEKDKELIIEHEYPLIDLTNGSISASEAYNLEKNAAKKIKTKVGLLAYSDVKYASWLEDYTKPYLLLSESGSGITVRGYSESVGVGASYIYPVIYIPDTVTTNMGDGSADNPYFIN